MRTDMMLSSDPPPVTTEDIKRPGVGLELFSSKLVAHRSRGSEGPSWVGQTEPTVEILDKVRFFATIGPPSDS